MTGVADTQAPGSAPSSPPSTPAPFTRAAARWGSFVDDRAPPEQVDAFTTILSGQAGGMPWEALAGTIERFEGPIARPIDLAVEGQRAHIRIPGAIELETTPLRDPVTGQEKEVHITYPRGGFFWNEGNVVTTRTMRVTHESLRMEWPAKYAATAEVNWTNAG